MNRRDLKYILFAGFSFFFLYFGYELIRSTSSVLVQNHFGSKGLTIVTAFSPIGTMLELILYNFLLSRYGARRALAITAMGSSILMGLGWFALRDGSLVATVALFFVREAYIVLITEQIWSLLNSQMEKAEAKRFYGAFSGIGSVGAITGGFLVATLAKRLGTEYFVLMTAFSLVGCFFCADNLYRLRGEPKKTENKSQEGDLLGIKELINSPTLVRLLGVVCTSQTIATLAGIEFQHQLQVSYSDIAEQTQYTGYFAMALNTIGLTLQFAFTPLVLGRVASGRVLMWIPILLSFFIGTSVFFPSLLSVSALLLVQKGIDYSVFRASKEVLYMPLSYQARFRSKELIDVFAYRATKGLSSGSAWLIELAIGTSLLLRPGIMAVACIGWISCARGILISAKKEDGT